MLVSIDTFVIDLESKLKAGYAQKELSVQLMEKKAIEATQRQIELETARQMETQRQQLLSREEALRKADWERSRYYQSEVPIYS
jgi:hypothetical protein